MKDIPFNNINTENSYISGNIDNLSTLILEELNLIQKEIHAIPIIYYALFCLVHPNEPIPRMDIVSKSKLIAGGMLSEKETFFGWVIDSRRMRISLPKIKALRLINKFALLLSIDVKTQKSCCIHHSAEQICFEQTETYRTINKDLWLSKTKCWYKRRHQILQRFFVVNEH